jgi:hypothetical protein
MRSRRSTEGPVWRAPRIAAAARAAAVVALSISLACGDSPSAPRTGAIALTVSGLPAGNPTAILVTGPAGSGYAQAFGSSATLENLDPGVYTVAPGAVSISSGNYASPSGTQQVQVSAAAVAAVAVNYSITTGSIALAVTGLPDGAAASVTISGSGGYSRQLTATAMLAGLPPGSYQVSSGSVSDAGGHVYSPVPLAQVVNVVASETPKSVTALYALATGALEVAVTGLPAGLDAAVTVRGPGGYSRAVRRDTTLVGLFPGTYVVDATTVGSGPAYAPAPPSQNAEVSAGLTPTRVEVTYTEVNLPPPPAFNLVIEGMYVTQAVQNFAGGVPLLAGMPGLLRVFVKASAPNSVITTVRVRVYQGASLRDSITLVPNNPSVPTTILEGTLSSSWNAIIPASLIQPGLRLVAVVDPGNQVNEADEDDNTFPRNGSLFEPLVEVTTPLSITLVPVFQTTTGITANVTASNLDDFLAFARRILPIRDYSVAVHEVFTTSAPPVESNNGNNGWFHVLGEINALRVAEGSGDYYMGIVGTPYNSGVAGMAFTPGRAAVSWDQLPSAAQIVAHELGHNLGRHHAPCGGPAQPDPSYPHVFGTIGVYGYDFASGILKPPSTSDIMGYCGFGWISDYTYTGVLDYRRTTPGARIVAGPGASDRGATEAFVQVGERQPTLVVWGWSTANTLVLEPAFRADTRPVLPARPGLFQLEARTTDGSVVFSYSFDGEQPSDGADPTARHFAFAIPVPDSVAQSIATLTLSSSTGQRVERTVGGATAAGALEVTRESPEAVRFRLVGPSSDFAVIRDRASGRIVAFVRSGGQPVLVRSRAAEFDVQLSDGVRSSARVVRPVRR